MKRIFLYLFLALLTGACARHKIIPDKKLASIFHDAFLTNAYLSNKPIDIDSLEIYEPIFAAYGYTTEDVYYTIGNFSKRKSARLSEVVEAAIDRLDAEGKYYSREVAMLDTIDNVALRTFTRPVYADSLIRVGALRDTARLHFAFDVQAGEYSLKFDYLIDSLDKNERGIGAAFWLERADGTHVGSYNTILRRGRTEHFSRRFTVDTTHRSLHIDLLDFRQKPARPSITVTDLALDYTPDRAVAVESLYLQQLDFRLFSDEFLPAAAPTDSL